MEKKYNKNANTNKQIKMVLVLSCISCVSLYFRLVKIQILE